MKKLIIALIAIVAAISAQAQYNVTAKMVGVPEGKVKSVLFKQSRESFNFDREGRVTIYSVAKDSLFYTYSGDTINIEHRKKGVVKDNAQFTIVTETPTRIVISLGEGVEVEEVYREDGQCLTSTISSPQGKMIQTNEYKNPEDKAPVKMIMSNGMQSEEAKVSNVKYDAQGNWTSMIVNSGEETDKLVRVIEYYED